MKRKILLFVKKSDSTFVIQDEKILNKYFTVKSIKYGIEPGLKTIRNQIRLLIWLLKNIWSAHFVYIWFADYHSFLPVLFGKIFKKKSILVLGGYDVTYIPEIKYGSFSNPLRSFCTKYSIKHSTINLAVSDYVKGEALKKIPNTNIKVCYNGTSEHYFYPNKNIEEKIVLTVGTVNTLQRIKIKGIDFFCEVAKKIPSYKFIAIGIDKNVKRYLKDLPNNLEILDKIKHKELLNYYQKAKVYCQFSVVESFCITLAESMLCECIGVVRDVGALKEIIGDHGFILEQKNVDKAVELVKQAMNSDRRLGVKARERIISNFSIQEREMKLSKLIMELNND